MQRRIQHIDVPQAAKVLGIVYALVAIPVVFVMVVSATVTQDASAADGSLLGIVFFLPLIYGVLSYLFTLVTCVIYNAVAARIGGIVIELEDETRE